MTCSGLSSTQLHKSNPSFLNFLSAELQNKLENQRQLIKDHDVRKAELAQIIEDQKNQLNGSHMIIEAANMDLKQARDKNNNLLDAKLKELEDAREDARKQKQTLIEEEETARLRYEDTYGRLLRIEQQCEETLTKNRELKQLKERARVLQEEDIQVNRALARSKPLVTEIMEYFNQKESENNNKEERIETLVDAL